MLFHQLFDFFLLSRSFNNRSSKMFIIKLFAALLIAASTSQGLVFDCTFSIVNLVMVGSTYKCRAEVKPSGTTRLDNVTGKHLTSDRVNKDVDHLYLINQNMKYIPEDIDKFFPELKAISWYNSNLQTLTSDDLKQFPNLMFLGVWTNKLKSLDGDLFQFTPKLRYLDFDNNLIENVGWNLLDHLSDLEFADFSFNTCIDLMANSHEAIQELKFNISILCSPSTDSTTTTTEPNPIEPERPPVVLQCDFNCHSNALVPHATDCQKYWKCIIGIRHLRSCPLNQYFDSNTGDCKDPSENPACGCEPGV